ncbi:peptidoglycan editing factor PgeF [Streptomyces sp. AJS327]|uniref:peptidoglycan editing factor PgeF n=1 Tax=Streptomyces sp. AJS327 TaxID=2545265 RepID=UPI0015DED904|nr:peptidoglycan editing factor PgeF [Streptomyces sp. AJS327]MBA0050334.1 peptidoglycan editing factor PgeF [Streptomyces sp. AJS327]
MITDNTADSGARFAFTDRWGGVSAAPYEALNLGGAVGDEPSAVRTNRALAARALGLEPERVVWMRQVHGKDVAVVDAPLPGESRDSAPAGSDPCDEPGLDGIVTDRPGLALAVLTADCAPVLLADPVAGVVGAAHAGRPGLVAGVVAETIAAMVRLGAVPERVLARTGPAVCGRCYEVPEWMREEVAAVVPEAYATTRWGTPSVDLAAGVCAQLARLDVAAPRQSTVCTLESPDHFSYRRSGTTGRLASYVWIEEGAA